LYNVYEDSFQAALPEGAAFAGDTLQGLVGGLLLSSLLAVSTVTVSFCANLCMVADKFSGAKGDITITPVKPRSLAVSYYLSTVINGLIISLAATLLGCIYLACIGWYLSIGDVLCLLFDVLLLVLFGTALSSLVCYPLTTQGQLSAAGSIVSAGYGFICGAYMPISSFSSGLQNLLAFFPGTYGTSLLRNHALRGVCEEMSKTLSPDAVEGIRSMADCDLQFFGCSVELWQMYLVLLLGIALLLGVYILLNILGEKRKTK
jgi:multidrug/hemolysin transport system permease protein